MKDRYHAAILPLRYGAWYKEKGSVISVAAGHRPDAVL